MSQNDNPGKALWKTIMPKEFILEILEKENDDKSIAELDESSIELDESSIELDESSIGLGDTIELLSPKGIIKVGDLKEGDLIYDGRLRETKIKKLKKIKTDTVKFKINKKELIIDTQSSILAKVNGTFINYNTKENSLTSYRLSYVDSKDTDVTEDEIENLMKSNFNGSPEVWKAESSNLLKLYKIQNLNKVFNLSPFIHKRYITNNFSMRSLNLFKDFLKSPIGHLIDPNLLFHQREIQIQIDNLKWVFTNDTASAINLRYCYQFNKLSEISSEIQIEDLNFRDLGTYVLSFCYSRNNITDISFLDGDEIQIIKFMSHQKEEHILQFLGGMVDSSNTVPKDNSYLLLKTTYNVRGVEEIKIQIQNLLDIIGINNTNSSDIINNGIYLKVGRSKLLPYCQNIDVKKTLVKDFKAVPFTCSKSTEEMEITRIYLDSEHDDEYSRHVVTSTRIIL